MLTVSGTGGATSTYELKATGNVETSLGATKVGEYQLVENQLIIQLTNAADIQSFSFKNA